MTNITITDPAPLIPTLQKIQQQAFPGFRPAQSADPVPSNRSIERIALPTAGALHLVFIADIIRIESDSGYTTVFTGATEKIILSRNIKDFQKCLPETDFFRIHQSHIINMNHVEKVLYGNGDFVQMKDGACLPISRRRREEFMPALLASGAVKRV
jgi:DNA-binding LytR/AlgR family response regulator